MGKIRCPKHHPYYMIQLYSHNLVHIRLYGINIELAQNEVVLYISECERMLVIHAFLFIRNLKEPLVQEVS